MEPSFLGPSSIQQNLKQLLFFWRVMVCFLLIIYRQWTGVFTRIYNAIMTRVYAVEVLYIF